MFGCSGHSTVLYFLILVSFLITEILQVAYACSCKPEHPQRQHCDSDFVILAKIKSVTKDNKDDMMFYYNIKIRRKFKMTEKSSHALMKGKIWTMSNDALCGVKLQTGKKYLLAGRLQDGEKATIDLCSFYQDWSTLTLKQKKGFKLLYHQGCDCKIESCPPWRRRQGCKARENTCIWDTFGERDYDCQQKYSVCLRHAHGKCEWARNRVYRGCLRTQKEKKEQDRLLEP